MSWIKLEIVKVNKDATPPTFKLKSSGTERKLASSEEGKERTLTMTKETLDKIRGLLNGGAKKVLSEKKQVCVIEMSCEVRCLRMENLLRLQVIWMELSVKKRMFHISEQQMLSQILKAQK